MTFRRFLARTWASSLLVLVVTGLVAGNAVFPALGMLYGLGAALGPIGFVVLALWTFMAFTLVNSSRSISQAEDSVRAFVIIGPIFSTMVAYVLTAVHLSATRPFASHGNFHFTLALLFAVVGGTSILLGLWWKHSVLKAVFRDNKAGWNLSGSRWDRPSALFTFSTVVVVLVAEVFLTLTLYSSSTLYVS